MCACIYIIYVDALPVLTTRFDVTILELGKGTYCGLPAMVFDRVDNSVFKAQRFKPSSLYLYSM